MRLQEFINKWTGVGLDFDGSFGFQCFDLYRQYCKDVLDVPQSPPTGTKGAVVIKDTYLKDYFTWVDNTPDGFPLNGDIVVWGTTYGPYGHVAVATEGNSNTFTCFSQNDPLGALCGLKIYHSYMGVLGWLHPINNQLETMITDDTILDFPEPWNKISVKDILSNLNSVSGLKKAGEDCDMALEKSQIEARGWKDKYDLFVARLAKKLDTTQDDVRIEAEIDELIKKEDKLTAIVDNRPIVSASPIHKLLEGILVQLRLLVKKWKKK